MKKAFIVFLTASFLFALTLARPARADSIGTVVVAAVVAVVALGAVSAVTGSQRDIAKIEADKRVRLGEIRANTVLEAPPGLRRGRGGYAPQPARCCKPALRAKQKRRVLACESRLFFVLKLFYSNEKASLGHNQKRRRNQKICRAFFQGTFKIKNQKGAGGRFGRRARRRQDRLRQGLCQGPGHQRRDEKSKFYLDARFQAPA